jgi:serine/threonine protein kinase
MRACRHPEQPAGAKVRPAVDRYGLGGVLYYLLTARHPLLRRNAFQSPQRVRNDTQRHVGPCSGSLFIAATPGQRRWRGGGPPQRSD